MMFVFIFLHCFSNFPAKSHLIVIFFSLVEFLLPLHSHSVLHDHCSVKAVLVQYQILLKEVMLNQKLFVIHD